MIGVTGAAIGFVMMLGLMMIGLPVAIALFLTAFIGAWGFLGWPTLMGFGNQMWSGQNDFILTAIPLFVFLGEILVRSGVADGLYRCLSDWLRRLPGGLLHTNIGASAVFAAVSGSSVATAATIGTVAVPLLHERQYDDRLTTGSIAAGATLGILIPPSINMIVYAVLTNTSVPKLYLAGIVPGTLLALSFMVIVLVACLLRPSWGGNQRLVSSLRDCIASLVHLVPPLGVFLVVVGSIYAGIATATEAASLGVMMGLALAAWTHTLSLAMLRDALLGTMKSTGMIMLIVVAAYFLNFVMSSIGLTTKLTDAIQNLGLGKWHMLFAVVVFYVVLGCFMETLSMMITTVPVIAPVMQALGFDMVWFGIVVIVLVETALITPPVGLNLFVVHNLRRSGSLNDVIIGALPFVAALFTLLALLAFFPGLALWLPQLFS